MVLSVFHFHNPNADYAQFEGIDVLKPRRQQEIATVLDALERYGPTKIAVERPTAEAEALNEEYERFRNGAFDLTRNEVHQLGFRLAERLEHDNIYPVDYLQGFHLDSIFAWERANSPQLIEDFNKYIAGIVTLLNDMQRNETIGYNLRFLNAPENVLRAHEPYAVQATIGEGDNQVGARMVAGWYERNLHIFANLARVASSGDRILLIIGAGHAPVIQHLVHTHPGMTLVEANEYLK